MSLYIVAIEVATGRFGNLTDQLIEKNQLMFHSGKDFDSSSTDLHHIINEATKYPPTISSIKANRYNQQAWETLKVLSIALQG